MTVSFILAQIFQCIMNKSSDQHISSNALINQDPFPNKETSGVVARVLPIEVECHIYSFLDVFALKSLSLCSRYLHNISSDCRIWSRKCEELWKHKVFVCQEAKKKLKCIFI